jgi:hypothetical protein
MEKQLRKLMALWSQKIGGTNWEGPVLLEAAGAGTAHQPMNVGDGIDRGEQENGNVWVGEMN